MCGIAGVYYFDGRQPSSALIQRMTDIMAYRGPDGEGIHIDAHIGLGHRRLAIIDLSPAGHQPMTNEDGKIWLVFNGEIYNYRELIPVLEASGHTFRSRSDSEVILHAYEEWGEDCVNRFNGMWAFAIWDTHEQKLFLSRDRFGVKPLYYYSTKDAVYFASEIKALLTAVPEARQPNYPYLHVFLRSGYLDDGEDTSFQGVKQLLPSHSLSINSPTLAPKQYWDFDLERAHKHYDYAHPEVTFRSLLADSVRLRLRSDVPVGTCLSGGLDSSSIAVLASGVMDQRLKTFSCIYSDAECDESRFIDVVTARAGSQPYPVYPDGSDLFEVLPKLVWHQDEPTRGPGLYSQWRVMQEAQGKVKVLLDGQGADELLGGYHSYFDPYLASIMKEFRSTKQLSQLSNFVRAFWEIKQLTGDPNLFRKHVQYYLPWPIQKVLNWTTQTAQRVDLKHLEIAPKPLHEDFEASVRGREIQRQWPVRRDNELDNTLYWHLMSRTLPALLHYEDRNSMAFSLEARTPFLDYRLGEFCMGLPYDMKIRYGTTKYILRMGLENDLPKEVCQRRDKKGYPTPMARWFRTNQRANVEQLLFSDEVRRRKLFNLDGVKFQIDRHNRGEIDASWEIYRWITTELWFRQFID